MLYVLIVLITLAFIIAISLHFRFTAHHPRKINEIFPFFNDSYFLSTHRGFGKMGSVAENTLDAFETSTRLGFKCHEMDIRLSKDSVPVIFHGPDLKLTTSGSGKLESKTIDYLETLDWGYYLATEKGHKKVRVPLFREYVKTTAISVLSNIELKRDFWDLKPGLEKSVTALVQTSKNRNRIFYSSFSPFALLEVRKYDPQTGIALLIESGWFLSLRLKFLASITLPDFINPPDSEVDREFVVNWKTRGYSIIVWTVNSLERARQLKEWGVDMVITDDMTLIKNF